MSLSSSSSSSYQHIHMATTSISTDDNSHAVVKGKRTKRQRSTTQHQQTSSTTSSAGTTAASDEDEDLASCLILLAQGRALDISSHSTKPPGERKIAASSRMFAEAPTTAGVFECKTCNKCFPTFQALGGHRASHKKPKTATATNMPTTTTTEDVVDEKVAAIADENQRNTQLLGTPSATPIQPSADIAGVVADGYSGGSSSINPIKGRVHECSICGSEFSSGQALGGHMRRHRSATTTAAAATAPAPEPHQVVLQGEQEPAKKERSSVFSLDLNLPAPSDDDRSAMDFPKPLPSTAGFTFFSPSAVALVDCHY